MNSSAASQRGRMSLAKAEHRDMRISVELILSLLSQGATQEELLEDYSELEPERHPGMYRLRPHSNIGRHAGSGFGREKMRFLNDRCAGRRLAEWLRNSGHDVVEAQTLGPDPGDRALLERAGAEERVLVTLDKDFGELINLRRVSHAGLILLPDVRVSQRIETVRAVIEDHCKALEERAVVTVRSGRIRISHPPTS